MSGKSIRTYLEQGMQIITSIMVGMIFRAFGKAMDTYTAIRYGAESPIMSKKLFGELIDKDMTGNSIQVNKKQICSQPSKLDEFFVSIYNFVVYYLLLSFLLLGYVRTYIHFNRCQNMWVTCYSW